MGGGGLDSGKCDSTWSLNRAFSGDVMQYVCRLGLPYLQFIKVRVRKMDFDQHLI